MARTDRDNALAVDGLKELRKALKQTDAETDKFVRQRLKEIVAITRNRAASNAPVGQRSAPGHVHLRDAIKTSVAARSASVFTTAPHGYVQDRGGKVGREGSTILKREDVSQYMTKAQTQSAPETAHELEALLDDIERELDK